jgi:hypothetical protein
MSPLAGDNPPRWSSPRGSSPGSTVADVTRHPLSRLADWLRTGEPPHPSDPADAEALVAAARVQRVAPLLFAAVQGAPGWTDPTLRLLRDDHHAAFATGARRLHLARRLLESLERAGVRALPMKGVAVVERAYGSLAERPMGDVDLLVLGGWGDAVAVMASEGLRMKERGDHAWSFQTGDGQTVELHHSVTSCPGLFPLDAAGVWARSVVSTGRTLPRGPSAEDLLVHLGLHAAFQHASILTLSQYLDFKRLFAAEPIDAAACRHTAEATGSAAALGVSLAVADALVGVPGSAPLRAWALGKAPEGLRHWLQRRLADQDWFLPPRVVPFLRLRWGLSAGRRRAFLAGTLLPEEPGQGNRGGPGRRWRALRRAVGLVSRWL